jgi:hypothetical protein
MTYIKNDLEGNGRGLMDVLSQNLAVWIKGNHEQSVRIAGVAVRIQTENLPITKLESVDAIPAPSSVMSQSWKRTRETRSKVSALKYCKAVSQL